MNLPSEQKRALPRGRPTKYREEYCEMFVEASRKGHTIEMFADSIDVHKDSLYEWGKVHKDFSDALKRGRQAQEAVMQVIGLKGIRGEIKGFNAYAWTFWMQTRHNYTVNGIMDQENIVEELDFTG